MDSTSRAAAVIVAAGSGERFGHRDKAFVKLAGRPIVSYSIEAAVQPSSIDQIVLVVSSQSRPAAERLLAEHVWAKPVSLVLGGSRRQDSARKGLEVVAGSCDWVVIHDAARPLATPDLFDRCLLAARTTGGAAVVATPVTDTIKEVRGAVVTRTLPRDRLWSVQTPQAFSSATLLSAFQFADRTGLTVTDEAALVEAAGISVTVVQGPPANLKITYPEDLAIAEALLRFSQRGMAGAP